MASSAAQLESRQLLRQLSHQSSEGSESIVSEELELLRNVYFDELDITHTESGDVVLSYHITPSTADDKDRQFVYLDLTIALNITYPNLKPEIHFGESRGLSDAHLRGISEGLHHKSLEYLGSPMIYELVEYTKDCLTDNNRPCGQCAICQFGFKETDDFTKTHCYHYFHLPCLASYVEFYEQKQREGRQEECQIDLMLRKKPKQLECPVCREPVAMDAPCLEAIQGVVPSSAADSSESFRPSKEMQSWQVKMASLLRQQREKGGVIDPSAEDDVIDDSWVSMAGHRREGDARMQEQPSQQQGGDKKQLSYRAQHQGGDKEQLSYWAQQQGGDKEVGVTQHRRDNATTHPTDVQSSNTSDTKEKSCKGSARDRQQQTRRTDHKHGYSRPTKNCDSRPRDEGPCSRPLGEHPHSRPLGEHPHSRPLDDGPCSRPLDEDPHSRQQDKGLQSRPLGDGPHSKQLNKRPYYYRDHRPVNQVHKNSRHSNDMRQAGGYNSASGGRDRRRYNPHCIQDENYHRVYSSRPKSSRDEHYHKQRDSKPKHVQEVPVGGQVASSNQKVGNKEVVVVVKKEEIPGVEDPPWEQTCSRERGAESRQPSSGRNASRGSSREETRESGYHRNQWSYKRTEKRDVKGDTETP